jgi:hypothetical protein
MPALSLVHLREAESKIRWEPDGILVSLCERLGSRDDPTAVVATENENQLR